MRRLPDAAPTRWAALLLVALLALQTQAARADVNQQREQAVALARSGDHAAAIGSLERLLNADPEAIDVHLDLAVVAAWGGDDGRTLQLLDGMDIRAMPVYVLSAYAKSARNLRQWQLSERLYDALIQRQPQVVDHRLGRSMALADAERFAEANQSLREARSQAAGDSASLIRVARACGYVAERQGHYTRALACYEEALALDPELEEAQRRRILVASALGASVKALEEARRHPHLLTPEEHLRLELDAAAMHIRWADLPNPQAPLRDARIALSAQDDIVRDLGAAGDRPTPDVLLMDRVAALAAGYRMAEAAALFDRLREPRPDLTSFPSYVLAAAGQAYLYQEQPEDAEACFEAALAKAPERFDLKIGLFYALSDQHDYPAARQLAEALMVEEAPWKRPAAGVWIANQRFAEAREVNAMEQAFREDYDPALRALDEMLTIAPANSSLRLARAQLMQWRGWNEKADREATRVLASEPDSLPATVLTGYAALDTQRFTEAEDAVQQALRMAPYSKTALELGQRWLIHNRAEFTFRAEAARSDGATFGSEGWRTDAHFFSRPVNYHYRAFVHDQTAYAEFEEGKGRDHRLGAGLEYRNHRVSARAELHQGIEQNEDAGVSASATWRQSDFLSWNVLLGANTPGMPLRGTRAGITADEAQAGARYRWHEAREATATVGVMDMDDDNRRRWVNLGLRQRVLNAPRHKLIAGLSGYASRNSEPGTVYYNPESDREVMGELTHEWRILRHYDQALTQRLSAGAGSYWQENYGSGSVWRLALEHDWQLSPRAALSYGISWAGRVYDGEREHEKSVFMTFRGYP